MAEGLSRAEELYRDRGLRTRELKAGGARIIGYLCCYTPVEMITAAGFVPYRITGDVREPVTKADSYIEGIACPFVRSCFDIGLKDGYDFLDGFIAPHSCDNIVKLYDVWKYNLKPPYARFINLPHTLSAPSFEFFRGELGDFKRDLEKLAGHEVGDEALNRAIGLHNEQRALVRELYDLCRGDPPLVSGPEKVKVTAAIARIPVEEGNDLLRAVIEEVKGRSDGPQGRQARLLIYGSGNDDVAFVEMVEGSGANVVVDDLCFGTRPHWHDIDISNDPVAAIADRYLGDINCPRTYREYPGTYREDVEGRFSYLGDFAREYGVDGVISYVLRYCDTHAFDAIDVRDYFQAKDIPVLDIEDEYSISSIERLKTRVQAFLEMIG
ncbi:2-hydroxyacyl-CoA dehydratase subunit D [Chloroflexota bacterium]